jgi:cytochrome bd ubiquinol oxidase subunit II
VLHEDAHRIYDGLVFGRGLAALIVSGLAGAATLGLVVARRYEPARYSGAVAVAAVVIGWGLAQEPVILPGLTIHEAAASRDTLWAVIIAVVGGGLIVFPSMALLFRLTLGGALRGPGGTAMTAADDKPTAQVMLAASAQGLLVRVALACLVVGFGFLSVLDAGWAHAIGVAALAGFLVTGFLAVLPDDLAGPAPER